MAKKWNLKAEDGTTYKIHISELTGKMHDMQSLGTSCKRNQFCAEYAKDPTCICHECYAQAMFDGCRKNVNDALEGNEILKTVLFPVDSFPMINQAMFRLESFGDLENAIQAANYIRFAIRNPHVKIGWWTKNPGFIDQAFKMLGMNSKPENLQIVLSSRFLNQPMNIAKWWFADRVFTVYTAEYAIENNIVINCGSADCLGCRQCYNANGCKFINEMLKKDQKRYYKMLAKKTA